MSHTPHPRLVHTPGDDRPVLYFGLELTLESIPEADSCPFCGSSAQRELIDYQIESSYLRIHVPAVPAYGCTDCGLKTFAPHTTLQILELAVTRSYAIGDTTSARFFEEEAQLLRDSLISGGAHRAGAVR